MSLRSGLRAILAKLSNGKPSAASSASAQVLLVLLLTALAFLLVEGAGSVAWVLSHPAEVVAERAHTEYDAELGWVNQRNVRIDDLYGPGRYLKTNSQRFRNGQDFETKVPKGRARVICTGDSFTLGYGVSNDDAWCERLSRKDGRLETVNMGQGGYGVDQAYLWYRRDGLPLEHDALVFAFILEDFTRMMNRTFLGYPKPVLSVRGGRLVVAPPDSRWAFLSSWLRQRAEPLGQLRSVKWLRGSAGDAPAEDRAVMTEDECKTIARAVFDDLKATSAARGVDLVAVLLPTEGDYQADDPWHSFLDAELRERKIQFVDLIDQLKQESPETARSLFRGHYNERGNRWVANHLYAEIMQLPRVAARLGIAPATSESPSPAPSGGTATVPN